MNFATILCAYGIAAALGNYAMNFRIKDLPNRIAGKISAFATTLSILGLAFAVGGCTLATGGNAEPRGQPTTVDVSPDGRHLVFTGNGRGNTDIFTLDFASGTVEQLTDTDAEEMHPKYSPDGQSLVFSRAMPGFRPDGYLFERYIYVMDIATKKVTQITDDPAHYDYSPAFSSDGRFVVFDGATPRNGSPNVYVSDVYCTEFATKKITRLTNEALNMPLEPVFWQSDKSIVFTVHRNSKGAEGTYLVSLPFDTSNPPPISSQTVLTPKGALYASGLPMENGRLVLISDPGRKWVWRLTIREADGSYTYLDDSINSLLALTYDQANQRIFYIEGMNNLYCYDLETKTKKKIADGALFRNPLTSTLGQLR